MPQYRFWEQFLYDEVERLESRKPELYQNFIDTSHRTAAITICFTKWDLDNFAPLCYNFIAINYRVQTYQHYEIYGLIYWQNSKWAKNKWRYNVVTTSAANPRIVNSSPWLPTRSAWIKSGERKGLYTIILYKIHFLRFVVFPTGAGSFACRGCYLYIKTSCYPPHNLKRNGPH